MSHFFSEYWQACLFSRSLSLPTNKRLTLLLHLHLLISLPFLPCSFKYLCQSLLWWSLCCQTCKRDGWLLLCLCLNLEKKKTHPRKGNTLLNREINHPHSALNGSYWQSKHDVQIVKYVTRHIVRDNEVAKRDRTSPEWLPCWWKLNV